MKIALSLLSGAILSTMSLVASDYSCGSYQQNQQMGCSQGCVPTYQNCYAQITSSSVPQPVAACAAPAPAPRQCCDPINNFGVPSHCCAPGYQNCYAQITSTCSPRPMAANPAPAPAPIVCHEQINNFGIPQHCCSPCYQTCCTPAPAPVACCAPAPVACCAPAPTNCCATPYVYRDCYGNTYNAGRVASDSLYYSQYQQNNGQVPTSIVMNQDNNMSNAANYVTSDDMNKTASDAMTQAQIAQNDAALLQRIRNAMDTVRGNYFPSLNIRVVNGTVFIDGIVETEQERTEAKNMLQKVDGVKNIDDKLYVRTANPTAKDQEITNSATDMLKGGYFSRGYKDVKIKVQAGVVTLTGYVEDENQKKDAQDKVMKLPGVKSVDNQIKVSK